MPEVTGFSPGLATRGRYARGYKTGFGIAWAVNDEACRAGSANPNNRQKIAEERRMFFIFMTPIGLYIIADK
jgi:hypothetical protein